MPRVANSRALGAAAGLLALTALLAAFAALSSGACARTPAPSGDNAVVAAPAADNATAAAAAAREKKRRATMRKVAIASLVCILLLICFVVAVMIATRRLKIRYLHYDRKVKFHPPEDLWWRKPGDPDKPSGDGKGAKS